MEDATEPRTILVVEPDTAMRARVARILVGAGYRTQGAESAPVARQILSGRRFDAVILGLPPKGPIGVASLRRAARGTPLVVLCPAERIRSAVDALRDGADDYLLRPPDRAELSLRLGRLLEQNEMSSRIAFFRDELSRRASQKPVEARSPAMRAAMERMLKVAPMRSTVLVNGESGVGKELVARSIHLNSPRRDGPFVALNCAAMPATLIESELFGHEKGSFTGAHSRARGKFEIAHRGTLFLDEIAEMDPITQAKLLRVLEEREFMRVGGDRSIRVDVRLIAATNADLAEQVERGEFRGDLYYRLKVVTIDVPPLRDRRLDIPSLTELFMDELSRSNAVPRKAISAEALAALQAYHWPGNVRELKNLLESLLVSAPGEVIGPEDLPRSVRQGGAHSPVSELSPGRTLADVERELIRRTLEYTGGNRTHSASMLDIGVRTLQRKIRTYGIRIPPKRRRPRTTH